LRFPRNQARYLFHERIPQLSITKTAIVTVRDLTAIPKETFSKSPFFAIQGDEVTFMAARATVNPKTSKSAESPIDSLALEERIRRRAHEIYLQRGGQDGAETEDWLQAESEIRQLTDRGLVTIRSEKSRKTNEEPKYTILETGGPSDADAMGIPKVMDRKSDAISRLTQLGATVTEIENAFRDLETADSTEIRVPK
jgi:hypothetical protein